MSKWNSTWKCLPCQKSLKHNSDYYFCLTPKEDTVSTTLFTRLFTLLRFIQCRLRASHMMGNRKRQSLLSRSLQPRDTQALTKQEVHVNLHCGRCYEGVEKRQRNKRSEKWCGEVLWGSDIYPETRKMERKEAGTGGRHVPGWRQCGQTGAGCPGSGKVAAGWVKGAAGWEKRAKGRHSKKQMLLAARRWFQGPPRRKSLVIPGFERSVDQRKERR